jgi:hypothetical protein
MDQEGMPEKSKEQRPLVEPIAYTAEEASSLCARMSRYDLSRHRARQTARLKTSASQAHPSFRTGSLVVR